MEENNVAIFVSVFLIKIEQNYENNLYFLGYPRHTEHTLW